MNEPYEIFVIDKTIDELENLTKKGKIKDRVSANIGLELLESKKIKKIKSDSVDRRIVDDIIMDVADDNTIVATIDKNLKRKLLQNGCKIIEIINKGYLRLKSK